MQQFEKSAKLENVCYDIRGPVQQEAHRLEEEGHRILKLNIGNPGAFGLDIPEEIQQDVVHNLPTAQGYCDSKGLFSARKAVMQYSQQLGIPDVDIDDVFIGNGVSELIVMATQALLNTGDEVLIPAPDYPLWTAATTLSSGRPVHYRCDEKQDWYPDIDDIRAKITTRTRAIVLINPNNPTGAVYSADLLEQVIRLAREHDLVVLADEIYDKILYDGNKHIPAASLADDILFMTFGGLSKNYRAAGYRAGWMIISGAKHRAEGLIEGINMLASMRLCANVPAQTAIQTSLGGYQSINDLVVSGGRLCEQRDLAWKMLNDIPGVSCVKPSGALYLFPHLDPEVYPIRSDEQMVYDLLRQEQMLLVHGSAFNLPDTQHFRVVFLPRVDMLEDAIGRLGRFLEHYRQD
ncbi:MULTISPECIES: pyridoxal phosphate-dependent aminotransferase [Gammaproteobacteria]|jgi:alanine-synthesizing transaminase|uniref:Glutamate-pyruvate aminotransferase AlaA n=2 Tax=Bacteria TaxID=2 RepID=A0A9X4YCY0_9GAMM|nr:MULTISPECIES: pyridoxal phosphate-dependent aminotransferase [Gammaproteobacteria]KAA8984392.1 pyridoxal phosphate-dependent aminotransferase [Halospina sp. K52047b]MYL26880.1 aminotransferase class I/II-fold pyridoxal phosphate-dependent enzyme [Halomonas utahensis]MYL74141.1 aminotransferase class I/II-fold pyridoxal phosphate-dependent enzyme [Halomonas sp. 22501_18_FS]